MEKLISLFKSLFIFFVGFSLSYFGGYQDPEVFMRMEKLKKYEENVKEYKKHLELLDEVKRANIAALGPDVFVPPSAETAKMLIENSFRLALEPLKISHAEPHSSLSLDLGATDIEFANRDAKANAPFSEKEILELGLSLRNLMPHVESLAKLRERLSLHLQGFKHLEALQHSRTKGGKSAAALLNLERAVASVVAKLGGNHLSMPLWLVGDEFYYEAEFKSLKNALKQYKQATAAKGRSSEKALEMIEWVEEHNQMRTELLAKLKILHEKIVEAEKNAKLIFKSR